MGKVKIKDLLINSIFSICVLGVLFHFAYDLLGKGKILGIIFPVNESIFEHLKLALYPYIFWFMLTYFIYKKKLEIDFKKWFILMVYAIIHSIFLILALYYIYTGALGLSSTLFDILIYFISISYTQIKLASIYENYPIKKSYFIVSILILIILLLLFTIFTFSPPNIPIFID